MSHKVREDDASLRKLTEREKMQLVELSRTREQIILELGKYPSDHHANRSSSANMFSQSVLVPVDSYQSIYSTLSKTELPRISSKQAAKKTIRKTSSTSKYSKTSSYIDSLQRGLSMMPIMATSGDAALDAGAAAGVKGAEGGAKMRLPIFKLPAIDAKRYLVEKQQQSLDLSLASASSADVPLVAFVAYTDRKSFRKAMSLLLRSFTASQLRHVSELLALTDRDRVAIAAELERESRKQADLELGPDSALRTPASSVGDRRKRGARVFVADEFFSTEPVTTFMRAARASTDAAEAALAAPLRPNLDLGHLGLTADFQRFISAGDFSREKGVDGPLPQRSASLTHTRGLPALPRGGATGLARTSSSSAAGAVGPRMQMSTTGGLSGRKGAGRVDLCDADLGAAALTRALVDSLRSMDSHSKMIKTRIESAQELFLHSSQEANRKVRSLVFSVAAERMQPALYRLVQIDLRRGLAAWSLHVQQARRVEKAAALLRFLVVRNCLAGVAQLLQRVLRRSVGTWRATAVQETKRIKSEHLLQCIVRVQSVIRRRIALRRCEALKQRRKYQRLYDATIRIQALLRGTRIKWRYQKSRRDLSQGTASRRMQAAMRGYLARKRVHTLRLRRNKNLTASVIQRVARGRMARKRVVKLRLLREMGLAAVRMQALVRGFVARRTISTILVNRARFKYAARIQAVMRGALVRMTRERRVAEINEYRQVRARAVTRVAASYRGYRARLLVRMKLFKLRKVRDQQARAATRVTTMVRGFLCRAYLRDLRKERFEQWVRDARQWQEMWSDESAAWFYLNVATGEALWEPSGAGYVKSDGSLVLASGQIVEDPRNKKAAAAGEEQEDQDGEEEQAEGKAAAAKKGGARLCSECADRVAIRACHECGDKFCTKCYKSTHATGSRRNHTYSSIGPLDCAECELVLAERWCVSCDEAYCDGCWRKVHSRGKRRFHPYSEVSAGGRVDARIFTMAGDQLGDFDPAYPQQQADLAAEQAVALAGQPAGDYAGESFEGGGGDELEAAGGGQWTQYEDADGYPYWYDAVSGESTYEQPF